MRTRSHVLGVIAILLFTVGATSARAEFPRIRPLDGPLAALLASGYAQSPTFRSLVDRLERSDLVVHAQSWSPLVTRERAAGTLRFVTHAGGFRYLRIAVASRLPHDVAIALLGHELHHALEVADDPMVVNAVSFETLYRRIGEECRCASMARHYDTAAAREAQRRIAAELRAPPTRTIAAR